MGSSLLTDQDHSPARARRAASSSPQAGHDIPEAKIRERWENSRLNIIRLLPHLAEFVLWDNSAEAGGTAAPVLLLHFVAGKITAPKDLSTAPEWAKPIVAAALKLHA